MTRFQLAAVGLVLVTQVLSVLWLTHRIEDAELVAAETGTLCSKARLAASETRESVTEMRFGIRP